MPACNAIDAICGKASPFGRDAFHYFVGGTAFAVVCSAPAWPWIGGFIGRGDLGALMETGFQLGFLMVAVIVLFPLGHLLLGIGFWIREWWEPRCSNREYVEKHQPALREINNRDGKSGSVADQHTSAHVELEMSVFIQAPDLHAQSIRRLDTLSYLRPGLAASLLCSRPLSILVSLVLVISFSDFGSGLGTLCFSVAVGLVVMLLGRLSSGHAPSFHDEDELPGSPLDRAPPPQTGVSMKYFAYGSNMLTSRLTHRSRAPSAICCGIARLPGYIVRFHKVGIDGSGKCTLVETADEEVVAFGVLFEIADADRARLDRAEGVLSGSYVRRSVVVQVPGDRAVVAMTYIAGSRFVNPSVVPFDWYRNLVVAGAIEHGLPARYIEELSRVPAVFDPDAARSAQARHPLGSGPDAS